MIGEGELPQTVSLAFTSYAGMDIGRDNGLVVDRGYEDKAPYAFTGTVIDVVFDLKPVHLEAEKALRARVGPSCRKGRRGLSRAGRPRVVPARRMPSGAGRRVSLLRRVLRAVHLDGRADEVAAVVGGHGAAIQHVVRHRGRCLSIVKFLADVVSGVDRV
jgi:hypothetical protein